MPQDEFSTIERYFWSRADFGAAKAIGSRTQRDSNAKKAAARVLVGPGDDCAILSLAAGDELCASTDTLLTDVHFPAAAAPSVIIQRAMAANLSDLAAMGARPHSFLLALTLPELETTWLDEFATRLHQLASLYEMPLAGGDLCRGPLSLSMTVLGTAPAGTLVTRSGAKAGDDIYVTGFIGDAGAGLKKYLAQLLAKEPATDDYLSKRYTQPSPRIEAGQALRPFATAMIDISDGLLADLRHLLVASGGGTAFDIERIPLSEQLLAVSASEVDRRLTAMTGGDDYELCFTAPPGHRQAIQSVANASGIKMTMLGTVTKETGVRVMRNGCLLQVETEGYNHFSAKK